MATAEQTAPAEQETKKQEPARQLFRGPHKTLSAALVAAQLNAKAVEKEATNDYHKYKYASAEAIIEEARAALNSAGLATIMEHWEILPPLPGGGVPQKKSTDTSREFQRVKIQFKTLHADSDQTLSGTVEYHIVPESGRPDDKATATALTYAEGYYLRGLLCLPRVDPETDVDQRNDKGFDPSQRRNQDRQQERSQSRGQQRQQAQRPSGQQTQRPPQQSASGNVKTQPPSQPANGTASSQPQTAQPATSLEGKPQGSERYRWWAGKIVGAPDTNQLTGMTAAIGRDTKLDDAEKKLLADMASNEARRREQAQERAGDPPVGRPRDESAQA